MKRKTTPAKSPWGFITIAIFPCLLLVGFIAWRSMHLDEDFAAARAERHRLAEMVASYNASIGDAGNVTASESGTVTLTVADFLVNIPEREAEELALGYYQKFNAPIRVVTPAGQVLATAP